MIENVCKASTTANLIKVGTGVDVDMIVLSNHSPDMVSLIESSKLEILRDFYTKYRKDAARLDFCAEAPVVGQVGYSSIHWHHIRSFGCGMIYFKQTILKQSM